MDDEWIRGATDIELASFLGMVAEMYASDLTDLGCPVDDDPYESGCSAVAVYAEVEARKARLCSAVWPMHRGSTCHGARVCEERGR